METLDNQPLLKEHISGKYMQSLLMEVFGKELMVKQQDQFI